MSEIDKSGWVKIDSHYLEISTYSDPYDDKNIWIESGELITNPNWPDTFIYHDYVKRNFYEIPFETYCYLRLKG